MVTCGLSHVSHWTVGAIVSAELTEIVSIGAASSVLLLLCMCYLSGSTLLKICRATADGSK